jgi:uncharacterized SAM-binding protein YcdF (DUF218 family)
MCAAKYIFLTSLLWLFIISTGFIPEILVRNLETVYSQNDIQEHSYEIRPVYIFVLGAGVSDDSRLSDNNKLSVNSLLRLIEGVRIHRLLKNSLLVFSEDVPDNNFGQAGVMAKVAISLGIDSSIIEFVSNVRNTKDEAMRFDSKFGDKGELIIVTDAIHMPRAMKQFRKVGLDPIPFPTNYLYKNDSFESKFPWVPTATNIRIMELVFHEYAGLSWLWAGGQ